MKKNDMLTLIVIAVISAIVSIVLSNTFLTTDENRSQTVEVVESISTQFVRPQPEYFNDKAINPTRLIEVSPSSGTQPFGSQ